MALDSIGRSMEYSQATSPATGKQPPAGGGPAVGIPGLDDESPADAEQSPTRATQSQPGATQSPAGATQSPPDTPGFGARGRMRRRARFLRKARELAYRDLGGLVYSLHRFGQRNDALVLAKLETITRIDNELRGLESALAEHQPVTVLREAGVAACPRCAAIHGSDDRFCPNCGLAMDPRAERPVASAAVPAATQPSSAPAGTSAPIQPPTTPAEMPAPARPPFSPPAQTSPPFATPAAAASSLASPPAPAPSTAQPAAAQPSTPRATPAPAPATETSEAAAGKGARAKAGTSVNESNRDHQTADRELVSVAATPTGELAGVTRPGADSAQQPARPVVDAACPLCGTPLQADQEWCLGCGAAARTRLAAPTNWKAPMLGLALVVALALGALAAALVSLTGPSGSSAAPPAITRTISTPALGLGGAARAGTATGTSTGLGGVTAPATPGAINPGTPTTISPSNGSGGTGAGTPDTTGSKPNTVHGLRPGTEEALRKAGFVPRGGK